jgi:double-strand break repair protein MRE11
MDLLAVSGFVNYYGRVIENDRITVTPVLIRKGSTKLALYGLSNVRDERLFRTFREGNVKFLRPKEDPDDWFSVLAVHQNHASHSETNYLPEEFLPDFIHIVIWGHEHECRIDPVKNPNKNFYVIQPGSSIATSLSDGEAVRKHVGILQVSGLDFRLEKIALATVRPFKMQTLVLAADSMIKPGPNTQGEVTRWMISRVEDMIRAAQQEWLSEQPAAQVGECPLPIIRLRIEYSGGYEVENPTRFSNRFVGQVANTKDVVQYFRKKTTSAIRQLRAPDAQVDSLVVDAAGMVDEEDDEGLTLDSMRVQSLIQEYLRSQQLEMLQETALGDAVDKFVHKDDKQALKLFVDTSCQHQIEDLVRKGVMREEDIARAFSISRESVPAHSDIVAQPSTQQKKPRRQAATTARKPRRQTAPVEVPEEELLRVRPTQRNAARRAAAKSATIVVDSDSSGDEYQGEASSNSDEYQEKGIVPSDPDVMDDDIDLVQSPPPRKRYAVKNRRLRQIYSDIRAPASRKTNKTSTSGPANTWATTRVQQEGRGNHRQPVRRR